jgi:hypothetical protein
MKATDKAPEYLTVADAAEWGFQKYGIHWLGCTAYYHEEATNYGVNWALLLCQAAIGSEGYTSARFRQFKDIFGINQGFDTYHDSITFGASDLSLWDKDAEELPHGADILLIYKELCEFGLARHDGAQPPPPANKPDPLPPVPPEKPTPKPEEPKKEEPKPTPDEPKKEEPKPKSDWKSRLKSRLKWVGTISAGILAVWGLISAVVPVPAPILALIKVILQALSGIF